MSECAICDKHENDREDFIFSTEEFVISHYPVSDDTPTVYKGHIFVEPKRHVTSFSQLNESECLALGSLVSRGTKLLENELGAEHVYVFTISHLVPHLHIHLVPRYPNTPKEFWDRKLQEWNEAPMLGAPEREDLLVRLKKSFQFLTKSGYIK